MNEIFLHAVAVGDAARVRRYLAEDPGLVDERDAYGRSAVMLAISYRHTDIAALLVEEGAAVSPFELAALGDTERLRAALADADVNARSPRGETLLHLACHFGAARGGAELVAMLLEAGADPGAVSASGAQPLHVAVEGAPLEVVEALLDAGADVNARQDGGWTPLHGATRLQDPELMRLLLARGADPSLRPG